MSFFAVLIVAVGVTLLMFVTVQSDYCDVSLLCGSHLARPHSLGPAIWRHSSFSRGILPCHLLLYSSLVDY